MATTTTISRTPNGDVDLLNHTAVVADALAKAAILGAISGGMDHLSALLCEDDDWGVVTNDGITASDSDDNEDEVIGMNHWKWTTGAMMM